MFSSAWLAVIRCISMSRSHTWRWLLMACLSQANCWALSATVMVLASMRLDHW